MRNNHSYRLLPLAAAMFAAFGTVHAQDSEEVQALITPSSSVSIGVATVNGDRDVKRFGQYTGMNKEGAYGLFDLNFVRRDEGTGTWLVLQGRDLGLDTRELGFTHQKQGDWKYAFDYSEMVRHDPYVIHTGLTGVGTANPGINLIQLPSMPAAWVAANGLSGSALAGADLELKIKRTAFGVSAEKWLTPEWQVEGSFRTEERKGARLFGRTGYASGDLGVGIPTAPGSPGKWAVVMTPEPINSTTNIFEGKLSFNRDKLALTGGYFGSFFNNDFGNLTPTLAGPGILNRGALAVGGPAGSATIAQLVTANVALPPDNQAHQLYLSGTYAYSSATRVNFKVAYTHATQNESFSSQGLTGTAGGPSSLGGVVNTTLAQLGFSSRVTKDLTVKASLRYEDRDDRTPVHTYNFGAAGGALDRTTNWPSASQTRTTVKFDGTYRLPEGYSGVLGGDWERKKAPLPLAGVGLFNKQVFFRPEMDEYGVRGELRKAMSETLNGSVGIEYKERRGGNGDWRTAAGTSANPLIAADPAALNNVFPDMYMDRDRTKARASIDWSPLERLDLQAVYEHALDQYKRQAPRVVGVTPTPIVAGAREMYVDSLSLDGSYAVTDNWKVSVFWTGSEYRWNVNKVGIGEDTRNSSQSIGVGVKGKVTSRLDIGADWFTTRDSTRFTNQVVTAGVVGNIPGWVGQTLPGNTLPKIHYNTDRIKLFANYALDKSSDLRFDAIYQHYKTDDWQWGYNGIPFLYSDNTTVSQPMSQDAVFIGARYIYKFQ